MDFRPAAPCRSPRSRQGRAFVAGLLALLSLVLSLDLHLPGLPGDAHELLLVDAGATYVPAASHPDQPVHIEGATAEERPSCSACILRLLTLGGILKAEGTGVPLASRDRLQLPPAPVELAGLSSPRSARAPPRA